MQHHERELAVYRITARFLDFEGIEIRCPTPEVLYRSQILYNSMMDCEFTKQSELYADMIDLKLWSHEEDLELESTIPKHIEYLKMELFKNYDDTKERNRIRLYLNTARTQQSELFSKKHAYDQFTLEGNAIFTKWFYIIENSTFYDGKPYKFDKHPVIHLLNHYNRNLFSERQIREIARTDPWRTIWGANKTNVFSHPASEMSEDQKRLVSWSILYDNIEEYPDAPTQEILKDDDAIDGWMLIKQREKNKQSEENKYAGIINRHKPNAEVMIVAKSQEQAEKIYSLNNETNRNIINSRVQVVKEKGEAKDLDFSDVRLGLQIQANQLMSKGMKNGKG